MFVDQSKASLDKGGSATLDAFLGLAPPSVHVSPAILPKSSKSKGPSIRCISHGTTTPSFDVGNVDSVDKVFRVLTKHMKVKVKCERQSSFDQGVLTLHVVRLCCYVGRKYRRLRLSQIQVPRKWLP